MTEALTTDEHSESITSCKNQGDERNGTIMAPGNEFKLCHIAHNLNSLPGAKAPWDRPGIIVLRCSLASQKCPMVQVEVLLMLQPVLPLSKPGLDSALLPPEMPRNASSR